MLTATPVRLRLLAVTLVVLALVATFASTAAAQTAEELRLDETQARIEAVRAELDAAEEERAGAAADLAEAEQRLIEVMDALAAAEQAVARQEQAVADAKAKLAALQEQERRQEATMSARLVTLYKSGSTVEFAPLLTAENPSQALQRTALVDAVVRSDRESFEQVNITQTAITAQRKQLAFEQRALERVAAARGEVVAAVEEIRSHRSMVLAASTARVENLASQETHLEAESQELAAIVQRAARVEAVARAATSVPVTVAAPGAASGAVSGGWTWPASGPVTSEFGYRWGRMHEGIDIGAPSGAPIWAAAAGVVSYAGSMSGYGNLILVDHGGGVATAYAHQSAFAVGVGTQVSAGQQIGYVGSTGNSTGPHLHFEVRIGGSPQNPRSYLP